jgi:hypothetical protein
LALFAAAMARGVALGRQIGQRPWDKKAKRVLSMHRDGLSYRLIGRNLGLSNKAGKLVRDRKRLDVSARMRQRQSKHVRLQRKGPG